MTHTVQRNLSIPAPPSPLGEEGRGEGAPRQTFSFRPAKRCHP
jgi:hypothetical protein